MTKTCMAPQIIWHFMSDDNNSNDSLHLLPAPRRASQDDYIYKHIHGLEIYSFVSIKIETICIDLVGNLKDWQENVVK